jgi:hypothetical protein
MKRPFAILLIVVLLFGALLGLPLLIGIWLPDVITAPHRTLAEQHLSSGYLFQVVQYWNRGDFYTTELRVTSPDGHTKVQTLDGDDSKRWSLILTIDEQRHSATITQSGIKICPDATW